VPIDPPLDALHATTPLREVSLEIEAHTGADGWDQPARLFALVSTTDLVASEPALAEQLGIDLQTAGELTPVEQEVAPDADIEELLGSIEWPLTVAGCALVMERVMLPSEAEDDLPEDPAALVEAVAAHPDRQDVRLVAAVLRGGERHGIVRARTPEDGDLLEGPDLVPGLHDSLLHTLT
jgi:hypothetical protein